METSSKYDPPGRDTVYIFGDGKFQIGRVGDRKSFHMCFDVNSLSSGLLSDVKQYRDTGSELYVISKEGYAVVDGATNTCKLFLTIKERPYVVSYYRYPEENARITELTSYDDFTDSEREIFAEMLTA